MLLPPAGQLRSPEPPSKCPSLVHLLRQESRQQGEGIVMVLINEVLTLSLSLSLQRSRITEAINKSLSETPSQKTKVKSQQIPLLQIQLSNLLHFPPPSPLPQLPAEWSKYACGQTADQRVLTEEARSFLLRPRQLHFDEES